MTRSSRLEIGGQGLEASWLGPDPASAPTLVFLHPGMGSASTWRDLPARLAATTGCGALVYSRAGHGGSDPLDRPLEIDFMHREALEVLPELVEVAGLREFVLIGHSDGGSIALIYAGGVGHLGLRGVATLAAHVFCEIETVRSARRAEEKFRVGDLRQRLEKHHGEQATWVFETWLGVWTHADFASWNLEEFLPPIRVPLLAIQGEDDEYGTRAQLDAISAGAPALTEILWLPGCGHAPHRDRPVEVERALDSFIRKAL